MGVFDDLFGGAGGFGGDVVGILLIIVIYVLPLLLGLGFILMKVHEKKVYIHPVRIFKRRDSGKVKEINKKGGFVKTKSGIRLFRVKIGAMPWSTRDEDLPDMRYMDEDDRVYYNQIDPDMWIQCDRTFTYKRKVKVKKDNGEVEEVIMDVEYTPVPTDIKSKTISELQKAREVLGLESTWSRILPHITLLILGLIFLIAYYMLMNNSPG